MAGIWLIFIFALALTLLLTLTPNIAHAQTSCTGTETTISADSTTVQAISTANGCLTINQNIALTIASGTSPAVTLSGGGTSLLNSGTISVTSTSVNFVSPYGVLVSANNVVITNSATGTISTTQALVNAIRVIGSNVTINNSGTIITQGNAATGIRSTNLSNGIKINHLAGTITTQGPGSHGIRVGGGGNGVVQVRSSINAQAAAYAARLVNDNQLDLELESGETITGSIRLGRAGVDDKGTTTTADDTPRTHRIVIGQGASLTANADFRSGIDVASATNTMIDIRGTLTIQGRSSAGIYLFNTSDSIVNNRGRIEITNTVGAMNYGIALDGASNATITNRNMIKTRGNAAYAIYSNSGSQNIIINHLAGMISTSGSEAHGIYVLGGGNGVTTVQSSIDATGANAYAIRLADDNQLDLELGNGEIITGGIRVGRAGVDDKGTATAADDTPRTHRIMIGLGARVTAISDGIHGIDVRDQNGAIEIMGTVSTRGDNAYGIYSVGQNSQIALFGEISVAGGANAVAIYLRNGQSLTLAPTARITGTIDKDASSTVIDRRAGNLAPVFAVDGTITNAQTLSAEMRGVIEQSGTLNTQTTAISITGGFSLMEIKAGGQIMTTDANAYGINVTNAARVTIVNHGDIETQGNISHGIRFEQTSLFAVINHLNGTISTAGATAHGIFVLGGGNGVVIIRSSISATGAGSYAIHLADENQLDLDLQSGKTIQGNILIGTVGQDIGGNARTHRIMVGRGASISGGVDNAAVISAGGAANIEIQGEVTSTGVAGVAIGITVSGVTVTNSGMITTTGTGAAHGIHIPAAVTGAKISHMAGTISTAGAAAHGIFVLGGGNGVITVKGSINVTGAGSYAIHLADENQLDLELQSGKTIQGGILLGTAGADDNGTPSDTSDDIPRAHSIIIRQGATLTTNNNSVAGVSITGAASIIINIQGTVETTGATSNAISITGGTGALITNHNNTITTQGANSAGIHLSNVSNNTIINQGVIETTDITGTTSYGIHLNNASNSTLTNHNTIKTKADNAHAIYADTNSQNTIINHLAGMIETTGAAAHGIFVLGGGNGVATIKAPINTQGEGAYAINLADTNQLTLDLLRGKTIHGGILIGTAGIDNQNTPRQHTITINEGATLTTATAAMHGIRSTGVANIMIKGTITTTGEGASPIYSTGDNTHITIDGTLKATSPNESSIALHIRGTQTLTITSNAHIIGRIDIDESVTFEDIVIQDNRERGISKTLTLTDNILAIGGKYATPSKAQKLPILISTDKKTIAIIDPTTQAASRTALAMIMRRTHHTLHQQLDTKNPQKTAQNPAQNTEPNTTSTHTPHKWGHLFGSTSKRGNDGTILAFEMTLFGGLVGLETQKNNRPTGIFLGFNTTNINSIIKSTDIDITTMLFGIYRQHSLNTEHGTLKLNTALTLAYSSQDITRHIIAPQGAGEDKAEASTDALSLSPILSAQWFYPLPHNFTLKPTARLAYTHTQQDSYQEQGSILTNLAYDKRQIGIIDAQFQLALTFTPAHKTNHHIKTLKNITEIEFHTGFSSLYYTSDEAKTTLNDKTLTYNVPGDDAPASLHFGTRIHYQNSWFYGVFDLIHETHSSEGGDTISAHINLKLAF